MTISTSSVAGPATASGTPRRSSFPTPSNGSGKDIPRSRTRSRRGPFPRDDVRGARLSERQAEALALPTAQGLSIQGPARATTTIALAHGGAGMDSPFLNFLAKGLGERGFRVARIGNPLHA